LYSFKEKTEFSMNHVFLARAMVLICYNKEGYYK